MLFGLTEPGQVGDATLLEELRRPTSVGTEQQTRLVADDTGVQVRHRHGRGADGSLAVDLGAVLVDEFGVGASQEGTADREASEALGFLDAGLLQQVQGAATRADEYETRANGALFTGTTVGDLDGPGLVRVLGQVGDLVAEVHLAAGLADVADELLGERSEIDVGAVLAPVQGDGIGEVASLGHERQTAC